MKTINATVKKLALETKDLLTVAEVCKTLKVSRQTLYNRDDITGIKIDNRVFFFKSDIEKLQEEK